VADKPRIGPVFGNWPVMAFRWVLSSIGRRADRGGRGAFREAGSMIHNIPK
jgi:hypothetical protein